MGQGHCVAAIDSLNLLVGNMSPRHAERYSISDEGLTRYVRDFYSYLLQSNGLPDSPAREPRECLHSRWDSLRRLSRLR